MARITLLSSRAIDRIFGRGGAVQSTAYGGPARWIAEALTNLGISYRRISPKKPAIIDLRIRNHTEHGNIASLPKFPRFRRVTGPVLVSTIAGELSLLRLSPVAGPIAIDMQGYVRALHTGQRLRFPAIIREKITVVKATAQEYAKISNEDRRWLRQHRVSIVTRGPRGCRVYDHGVVTDYPVRALAPRHTIGAGDVFFATFCAYYFRGRSVQFSVRCAQRLTSQFLFRVRP